MMWSKKSGDVKLREGWSDEIIQELKSGKVEGVDRIALRVSLLTDKGGVRWSLANKSVDVMWYDVISCDATWCEALWGDMAQTDVT